MARFLRILGFCTALLGLAAPALAEERIISFDSDVTVADDGELTVIETIRVRAEGYEIKRGIYRDFPTVYKGRGGETHIVGFEVVEVLRDGREENWSTEKMSNGVRVYIGDPGRTYLPKEGLEKITAYAVRTTRDIEDTDLRNACVWQVLPATRRG